MTPGDEAKPRGSRGHEIGSRQSGLVTSAAADDAPGVPGFRTWRGVYWFVLVWFAVCVAGLTLLTHLAG